MKRYLLSSVAFLAISSAALAADPVVFVEEVVVPAPVSIWEGAFIGVLGGYGWAQDGLDVSSYSQHDMTVSRRIFPGALEIGPDFSTYLTDDDSSWASDAGDGWWGGGVIGFNIQSGNFVFGVEGDISFSDIEIGSQSTSSYAAVEYAPRCDNGNSEFCEDVVVVAQDAVQAVELERLRFPIQGSTASTTTADANVDWYGTARLKAGIALNNFLIYGTGGLAFGQVKLNGTVNSTHSFGNGDMSYQSASFSDSSTELGWTLGAGVDMALTPNFIVGAFYRYVDLGEVSGGAGQGDGRWYGDRGFAVDENGYGSGSASADANFHTVGVRAVYKFDTGSLFN